MSAPRTLPAEYPANWPAVLRAEQAAGYLGFHDTAELRRGVVKGAASRFISRVRRALQKALAEEAGKGLTQSEVARRIGVDRSVISRELRGHKDMTLGRVAELAWAMGRKATFDLPEITVSAHSNISASSPASLPPIMVGISVKGQTVTTAPQSGGLTVSPSGMIITTGEQPIHLMETAA